MTSFPGCDFANSLSGGELKQTVLDLCKGHLSSINHFSPETPTASHSTYKGNCLHCGGRTKKYWPALMLNHYGYDRHSYT